MEKLCFEEDLKVLSQTQNTQPALVLLGTAYFRELLENTGIVPEFLAGHSIGELTALTCAGAIQFSDAIKLARSRGCFMQNAVPAGEGAMAAVTGLDQYTVEELCLNHSGSEQEVFISNYNSSEQIVVSGMKKSVTDLKEEADKMGARTVLLNVSGPFHSKYMKTAAQQFAQEITKYSFSPLKYKVISNVSALPYETEKDIVHNLTMQIVKPVQWHETMEYMRRHGVGRTIELGPGKVLRNLTKRNLPEAETYAYDIAADRETMMEVLQNPAEKKDFFSKCLAICVSTKNRNWDDAEYEKEVSGNYNKIKEMEEMCKNSSVEKEKLMGHTLELVQHILKAKKMPVSEQVNHLQSIIRETGTEKLFSGWIGERYSTN